MYGIFEERNFAAWKVGTHGTVCKAKLPLLMDEAGAV
jgi:hypothetical protein